MKTSNGKRILMLLENCSFPRDDRVRREARALTSAGYQVIVIAPASKFQLRHEIWEGITVYRYQPPVEHVGFLGYIWEYGYSMIAIFSLSLQVFFREGFDIIHANQPPDLFAFIAGFYKFFGKKYVLDHHDLAPELYEARFRERANPLVTRILLAVEWFSYLIADQIIATNESYKHIEMERGHVPSERIAIVRNGPDLNELRSANPNPILEKNGKTLIGYVGVMGTQDGVDYLLRALNYLKTELCRKDFLCVLLGSGNALPNLKNLTRELDLDDHVRFIGWVDSQSDVARYLFTSDICVAPEPSDPYNDRSTAAKVMEYMATGKPVVCFELPEHRFSAQGGAVYARSNDELDMARKILLLMDNPRLRKEVGDEGRARILNKLAWQNQAEALIQAYDDLSSRVETQRSWGVGD